MCSFTLSADLSVFFARYGWALGVRLHVFDCLAPYFHNQNQHQKGYRNDHGDGAHFAVGQYIGSEGGRGGHGQTCYNSKGDIGEFKKQCGMFVRHGKINQLGVC